MQGAPGKTQIGGDLGLHHPGNPRGQHIQWTNTDYTGAPPPCLCTADCPWRAEVGGNLPTAIKAQLQEEGMLS